MPKRSTGRSGGCWTSASRPTWPRWTWPPKSSNDPANPYPQAKELVEGQPDDFGGGAWSAGGGVVLLCGTGRVAGQEDTKNLGEHGQGEAARKAEGTGETQGGTSEGGNPQSRATQAGGGGQTFRPGRGGPAGGRAAGGGPAEL